MDTDVEVDSGRELPLHPSLKSGKPSESLARLALHKERTVPERNVSQLNSSAEVTMNLDKIQKWIPTFGTNFWEMYANKLRVYGTEAEICRLGK
jgi:hypothetical protein